MIEIALKNLFRRRTRSILTLFGVAAAVGVLACLIAFGQGYQRGLSQELDSMGMQMMLVPMGCPYDAAARVLKGKTLDVSLPMSALESARKDRDVQLAAPLLMAALPRPSEGRTDLWVGVDESIQPLKPWWKMTEGSRWFENDDSVILGAEAASTELRHVGDSLFSPETNRRFKVTGILERSGTSDDSLFFIPIKTAQAMFHETDRLTAIAIRLRDPELLTEASARLQNTPGAQVVTMTEMMGTFLNLVGAVRTLVLAIAVIAVTISILAVFNTMLSAVIERTRELGLMRAIGASRAQIFKLLALESILLTSAGSCAGLLLAYIAGSFVERIVKNFIPLAPVEKLLRFSALLSLQCIATGVCAGLIAGLYPAWQASRLTPAAALKTE